ncbi:MAG: VWA domain-containing protein [Sphaerospermopsis sp. SIO1G1]|nr:VWA domain-containing protein [Sphaerospermopsis sp. SIO1G1]
MKYRQLPSNIVAKEFGEVNVSNNGQELEVLFTILMEPQGEEAEGWQTGVALDASASMKDLYGRKLEGKIPPDVAADYESKGWIESKVEEGRKVRIFQKQAYEDAIQKGYFKTTPNIVQPLAQQFTSYLAENLDADGGTTVIYWAAGSGSDIEVLGDFTASECANIDVSGPKTINFGSSTILAPAVKYFVERFVDAKRGMFIFITDGRIYDLDRVKKYTIQLAQEIASGQRHPVKCVLIGVGNAIDQKQLEELDDLETGTDVDIWDYKIAQEMASLVQIFAEVVDENQIVAPTGTIYDSSGNIIKKYTDGVPAKVSISLPLNSEWFELDVYGQKIRQPVIFNK